VKEPVKTTLPGGLGIDTNLKLAPFTSWLVGGEAEFAVQPKNEPELREAIAWALLARQPITFLGGGTNVLISDRGVSGLTVLLRKLEGTSVEESAERLGVECLAGTSKSELLKIFLKYRLEPALFLAGLPGDVGGGIVMNAGVGEMIRPREFVELVEWIEVLSWREVDISGSVENPEDIVRVANSLELRRYRSEELHWRYRHCTGWEPGVIVRVKLGWANAPHADILQRVKTANRARLVKQPLDMPSCGSVFVNPPPETSALKSGQLIEQSGLKGFSIGGAKVSEKHANFIVNCGGAKATDIDLVIRHVQKTVAEKFAVSLRTEVVYLGDWT
jgi:UDP-N-acetylmuramate dehydrogenase